MRPIRSTNNVRAALLLHFRARADDSLVWRYFATLTRLLEAGHPLRHVRRELLEGAIPDLPAGEAFNVWEDGTLEACDPIPNFKRRLPGEQGYPNPSLEPPAD